jgi:hypothetical protein
MDIEKITFRACVAVSIGIIIAFLLLFFMPLSYAQTAVFGAPNRTPVDCSSTIASGTVAQNLLDSAKTDLHGFCLMNLDATEFLYMNLNGTAVAGATGSYGLQPSSSTVQGGSFCAPMGLGVKLNPSVVAATTGHKFTCTWW